MLVRGISKTPNVSYAWKMAIAVRPAIKFCDKGRGHYCNISQTRQRSNTNRLEVSGGALAMAKRIDSDAALAVDTVALVVVAVVGEQVAHKEDVVPASPEAGGPLHQRVLPSHFEGGPPVIEHLVLVQLLQRGLGGVGDGGRDPDVSEILQVGAVGVDDLVSDRGSPDEILSLQPLGGMVRCAEGSQTIGGSTEGVDDAIAPILLDDPVSGVETVVSIRMPQGEVALGLGSSSHVLCDSHESERKEDVRQQLHSNDFLITPFRKNSLKIFTNLQSILAVWRSVHDYKGNKLSNTGFIIKDRLRYL
jgi:hypothetical protein